MRVYRYLSLDHGLHALQNNMIKIGRLLELNDPFDCFPRLTNSRELNYDEDADSFASRFLRPFASQLGVVCYSATISEPVLWSHYADAHKGIALGFDYAEGSELKQVIYQDERSELDANELLEANKRRDIRVVKRILSDAFGVKAKSWGYEKEHRQFIELSYLYMDGKHYFQQLPMFPILQEVVIAARSPLEVCDVESCLWNRPGSAVYSRKIAVKKAHMSPTKYEIVAQDDTRGKRMRQRHRRDSATGGP